MKRRHNVFQFEMRVAAVLVAALAACNIVKTQDVRAETSAPQDKALARPAEDIDAALSACGTARIVELQPEIQNVIENGKCSRMVKKKASDILDRFARSASGK